MARETGTVAGKYRKGVSGSRARGEAFSSFFLTFSAQEAFVRGVLVPKAVC